MNIKRNYYKTAEVAYLNRAKRLLEIVLEEYAYKHRKKDTNRFSIPRGRFESEGIYADDIDYCLEHFVNNKRKPSEPILKLDNNSILKNNIKFKYITVEGQPIEHPYLSELYEYNQLKYDSVFEFTLYSGNTYENLVGIYNSLLKILEQRKILVFKDISNFLYFEDRILHIKTVTLTVPIQIDLSQKKRRSPDKMYYFISSFVKLVKANGKPEGYTFTAQINRESLKKQIQKDHDTNFTNEDISNAKSNFMHLKVSEEVGKILFIGDYHKATNGYDFKLLLN